LYGVLHCARADREAAGGKESCVVPVGKELEKRETVWDGRESGVVAKAGAKGLPHAPGGVLRGAALSRDAGTYRFRDSAPVMARVK
jgi:hypothetical protein